MGDMLSIPLPRRQFLRATALAAAAAAWSDPIAWSSAGQAKASTLPVPDDRWVPTTCMSCAPEVKCSHLVHRVNGVAVSVRGNPAAPLNQGRNCARSNAMISQLYNPYRVKFPVKRTNPEKGLGVDPKWVEISWEEAFATVAAKLRDLKAGDSRKLLLMAAHYGTNLLRPFGAAFGTPNVMFGGTTAFCGGGISATSIYILGARYAYPDMPYAKYVINFGAQSIQGGKGTPRAVSDFLRGREQGVRVVNVAPMVTASTAKADEWVPITPGTVMPFCLSMAHVLVHELRTYDVAFLKNKTNAPYLIGPDGKYLRDEIAVADDRARLASVGKPLVWDATAQKARVFDDPNLGDPALEGNVAVNGVAARPVFQVVKDHLQRYTPEFAAPITDVPAATIRRLAKEWADNARIGETITLDGVTMPYRPVAALAESGAKGHIDNDQIVWSSILLCELVGAIGVPGAMNACAPPNLRTSPADGLVETAFSFRPIQLPSPDIGQMGRYPTQRGGGIWVYLAMNDPDFYKPAYLPEVLGIQGSNPLRLGADQELIAGTFKKFKFIFAISLVFDEPTEFADIVFPESSWLERYSFQPLHTHGSLGERDKKAGLGTSIWQPVVDPVFNTRNGDDVWLELARRVGIAAGPRGLYGRINAQYRLDKANALPETGEFTWTDVVDRVLKTRHGAERGLDWFKDKGLLLDKPIPTSAYYGAAKYPKARFPIYFEEFVWWHERLAKDIAEKDVRYRPSNDFVLDSFRPLPTWREHPEHKAPAAFPFYAINFKLMELYYANVDQPWLNELAFTMNPYAASVLVNPRAAAAQGLVDGATVVVESFTGGRTEGQIKRTNLVRPDVVAIGGAWGARSANIHPWARKGPHFNSLWKASEEFFDPIRGGIDLTTRVRLIKA